MTNNVPIHKQLSNIELIENKLALKKYRLVENAMTYSTHPSDLLKAQEVLNVNKRQDFQKKAYVIDPYQFQSFMGYKDKPYSLSYMMLRRMSYQVPIIRSIIGTRVDQVADFCEPQKNKYSTGFIIKKKTSYYNDGDDDAKPTKEDLHTIERITEFLLECGINNTFEGDDFDSFIRKIVNDSLTYDQMTFEVVHDRRGRPVEFFATDASTMRIADSFDTKRFDDDRNVVNNLNRQKLMGYYPAYCQIDKGRVVADFYPWELCFGVRNPTTSIYSNGYGVSEIEMLTQTITSMLWSDEYNRRFFSQGSSPKGFFKINSTTSISDDKMSQFKRQYQNMMSGVYNSHKTPVFEGDIEWIDLQHSNRDMEFAHWQEYLIKLCCAIFRIDPAEVNFPLSGGSEQRAMFEGNNEARLKHSKDKGLYPLLKHIERKINRYIVNRINPNFVFEFTGMNTDSPQQELENDIKTMAFMTIDEIRVKRGMKPLGEKKGGNIVANATMIQALAQQQMAEQGGGGMGEDGMSQEGMEGYDEEGDEGSEENPFEKAFNDYAKTLQ